MLAEGKSEAEIKQYFVDYYGARVLSEPPRTGINWLVYIVPPVAFLAGVYPALSGISEPGNGSAKESATERINLPHQDQSLKSAKESGTTADDEYIARLEEELKKRK